MAITLSGTFAKLLDVHGHKRIINIRNIVSAVPRTQQAFDFETLEEETIEIRLMEGRFTVPKTEFESFSHQLDLMETNSIQEGLVYISLPHIECIAQVDLDQPWQVQMANGDVLLCWDVTSLWERVDELLAVPPVEL